MATKRPTTTLLNKLSHLFHKSGSDEGESVPSSRSVTSTESGDLLEHSVRSKHHNDAMRAHELSQLRSIIRVGRGPAASGLLRGSVATPQTHSSVKMDLQRNSILNKIDGAEAHLEQWWGSHSGPAALGRTPVTFQGTIGSQEPDANDDMDLDFTGMSSLGADVPFAGYPISGPVPFTHDGLAHTALENGLRDAALLFAEGEFEAAEGTLSKLLLDTNLDSEATELLIFSLFDVFRCSGQKVRFEALALDYASRFGRSPAEWFSYPQQSMPATQPYLAERHLNTAPPLQSVWKCPTLLDAQAIADCAAQQLKNDPVCVVDWSALQDIDRATAAAFSKQLASWCTSTVDLQWIGVDCLVAAVQMCRNDHKAAENETWWLIELDMLCLLQQLQAFENLALEYCVAFEVSPPSWKPVACKLSLTNNASGVPEFVATLPSQDLEAEQAGDHAYVFYELAGNVLGYDPAALHALYHVSRAASQMTISCARLGRIDINAAGKLLNLIQECYDKACPVQFIFLPRLVQVYFHMLGMDKFASLSVGPH